MGNNPEEFYKIEFFAPPPKTPPNLIANAEIELLYPVFGQKLVLAGIGIWQRENEELSVSFPNRKMVNGAFYYYVFPSKAAANAAMTYIIAEFNRQKAVANASKS